MCTYILQVDTVIKLRGQRVPGISAGVHKRIHRGNHIDYSDENNVQFCKYSHQYIQIQFSLTELQQVLNNLY